MREVANTRDYTCLTSYMRTEGAQEAASSIRQRGPTPAIGEERTRGHTSQGTNPDPLAVFAASRMSDETNSHAVAIPGEISPDPARPLTSATDGHGVDRRLTESMAQITPLQPYVQSEERFLMRSIQRDPGTTLNGRQAGRPMSRQEGQHSRSTQSRQWQDIAERELPDFLPSVHHIEDVGSREGPQVWLHAPVIYRPSLPVYYGVQTSTAAEPQQQEWVNTARVQTANGGAQLQGGSQSVRAFVNIHADSFNFIHHGIDAPQLPNSPRFRGTWYRAYDGDIIRSQHRRRFSDALRQQEERDFLAAQSLSLEDYADAQSHRPFCASEIAKLEPQEPLAGFTYSVLYDVVCVSCNCALRKSALFLRHCGHVYCRACATSHGMVSKHECSAEHCSIKSNASYREIFL